MCVEQPAQQCATPSNVISHRNKTRPIAAARVSRTATAPLTSHPPLRFGAYSFIRLCTVDIVVEALADLPPCLALSRALAISMRPVARRPARCIRRLRPRLRLATFITAARKLVRMRCFLSALIIKFANMLNRRTPSPSRRAFLSRGFSFAFHSSHALLSIVGCSTDGTPTTARHARRSTVSHGLLSSRCATHPAAAAPLASCDARRSIVIACITRTLSAAAFTALQPSL